MQRPPVIGLVGGIGSGKSTVARALAALGCEVCDSDALAREVLTEPDVRAALARWWGPGVLTADGAVDRRQVGRIVFADAVERRRLEALVHPRIEERRLARFRAAPATTRAFVIDAPLLLEVGLDRSCDAVVFVDAPRATRESRVQGSRGWDAAELARRESAQWPLDRKRAAADHVLRNEGDLPSVRADARRLLDVIVAGPRKPSADPRPAYGGPR